MSEPETPPAARAATEPPAHAALLREFVNTLEIDGDDAVERLDSAAALVSWLAGNGLVDPAARATGADLDRARTLREGLREALGAHHAGEEAPAPDLDRLAADLPLRVTFGAAGPGLAPSGKGVEGALAALLGAVVRASLDGSWERLKVCTASTCRWAFYDSSRNRSRSWCAMRVCGNREKTRNYRARRRAVGDDA